MSETLEHRLVIEDANASATFQNLAQNVKATRQELAALEAEARKAQASMRLEDLASRGNVVEQLALKLRRTRSEISELATTTGNQTAANRAVSAAEREFAAALQARGQRLQAVAAPTREAADHIRRLGEISEVSGVKAGRVGAAFGRLGGAMAFLPPQVGAVVGNLVEASSALEAVGITGGMAISVLGPLAVAIGAVAGVVAYYRHQQEELNKATAKSIELEKEKKAAMAGYSGASDEISMATRMEMGGLDQAAKTALSRKTRLDEEYQAARAAIQAQMEDQQTQSATVLLAGGAEGANKLHETLQRELQDLKSDHEARLQNIQDLEEYERTSAEVANKGGKRSSASKAYAQAAKDEENDRLKAIQEELKYGERLAAAKEHLQGVTVAAGDDQRSAQDKLQLGLQEQLAAIEEFAEKYPELSGMVNEASKNVVARYQRDMAAANKDAADEKAKKEQEALDAAKDAASQRISNAQGYIGQAGGMLSGDRGAILGAVGSAGPIGAIISAILGAVTMIGAAGADGVEEKLRGINDDIVNGIRALPEIIGEVLPELSGELVPDLISSLIEAAPELGLGIAESIWSTAGAIIGGLIDALIDGFKSAIAEGLGGTLGNLFGGGDIGNALTGGLFSGWDSFVGSFDSGSDFIDRTGLALVHRKEQITPEGGRQTGAAAFGGLGGGPTINITGFIGADMLTELDRQMRISAGRGLF